MRFWKFGLFLLFCSLFGLQGCTGAEDKPAQKPEQKPDISFTPSEIQKSEISFLHNKNASFHGAAALLSMKKHWPILTSCCRRAESISLPPQLTPLK